MKLVIFGLTISSSWGNGHATNLRGLLRELIAAGNDVVFFERDASYYAAHRDMTELVGGTLALYQSWTDVLPLARRQIAEADVAMVTSFCPDGLAAAELIWSAPALRVFYDMDTPVTLSRFRRGESLSYVDQRGLGDYDLALSYTGGGALDSLRHELGARKAAPLYGSVDPQIHQPVERSPAYSSDLSYLGTYASERQAALETLFLEPARRMIEYRFAIAGAQYPEDFPWTRNIHFFQHLPPREHPTFLCSSRLTLNVTRSTMAAMGWCPSGRLFEAGACGVPILSDSWPGMDEFFEPGAEIIIAESTEDATAALQLGDAELRQVASAARERTLTDHTAANRARELEQLLEDARRPETIAA